MKLDAKQVGGIINGAFSAISLIQGLIASGHHIPKEDGTAMTLSDLDAMVAQSGKDAGDALAALIQRTLGGAQPAA